MDAKVLESQLESILRRKDQDILDHRKKHHQELQALTDEEWWNQLIERTKTIRPEMIAIFERNKDEMIAGRHKPAQQEVEFREKALRKKVLELLPFVYSVREDLGATGDLTEMQVDAASMRLELEISKGPPIKIDLSNLN